MNQETRIKNQEFRVKKKATRVNRQFWVERIYIFD